MPFLPSLITTSLLPPSYSFIKNYLHISNIISRAISSFFTFRHYLLTYRRESISVIHFFFPLWLHFYTHSFKILISSFLVKSNFNVYIFMVLQILLSVGPLSELSHFISVLKTLTLHCLYEFFFTLELPHSLQLLFFLYIYH